MIAILVPIVRHLAVPQDKQIGWYAQLVSQSSARWQGPRSLSRGRTQ
jgi:hypothetical protein